MGNKMCVSRRRAVAERFTRPQRLLRQPSDVDYKKLRKLILAQKLAPCFDAVDDPQLPAANDLEECPICFLYYPSLNRSRCCGKGICTECFLQMKPSHASRPAQCPYCKTSSYAVEYHGAKTEEEKGLEQEEEQKVIEAKIRMQTESQTEERIMPVNQSHTVWEVLHPLPAEEPYIAQGEEREIAHPRSSTLREMIDGDVSSYENRLQEVDVDVEEIMVMEAIWHSLQETRSERSGSRSYREHHTATTPLGDKEENHSRSAVDVRVASVIVKLENGVIQQQFDRNPCENFVFASTSLQP